MFKKILYPTDFSDSARAALAYVVKLREAGAEEVVLLHVYDERKIDLYWEIEAEYRGAPPGRVRHEVIKRMLAKSYGCLKELERELQDVGFKTKLIVVEGISWREIVRVATDEGVSLIVMGSHGERGFVERIVGSTTMRVLTHSPVPLLIARPAGASEVTIKRR